MPVPTVDMNDYSDKDNILSSNSSDVNDEENIKIVKAYIDGYKA